jgi:pyrroloquinoline quinone (PQQ) biosynthesis protein C
MSAFQKLVRDTGPARNSFVTIPLIQEVLRRGASREIYLDFLSQAYHHVKQTAPLLALAAARCGPQDWLYQSALFKYVEEERGHEEWILEDIGALGGEPEAVRAALPRLPCKLMVAYAHYVVDKISPYGLLGMVHVLEGMAVELAASAVSSLRTSIAPAGNGGFKYLTTHSDLDEDHSAFFADLIDKIDPALVPMISEMACEFYRLYGDIFREIETRHQLRECA